MSVGTIKSGKLVESSYITERNPISCHIRYNVGAEAPHATTERASYTVPAGKIAILKNALAHARVETVATTAGRKGVYIMLTIGGIDYHFCISMMGADQNVIGNNSMQMSSNEVLLNAGDTVKILTVDLSTAGTIGYTGVVLITQYDL